MAKINSMRLVQFAIVVLLVAALAACKGGERQSLEGKGAVSATKAFITHFGPAPLVEKGTCYAFVIYFPSAKEPGKAIPFPFFSFDEASMKKVALAKLIGGMADMKSYQGEILQPFPAGTRVLEVSQSGGVVTANFSKELAAAKLDPTAERALANAVALTLGQFQGVTKVAIQVEGQKSPLDQLAQKADESAVVQLSAPRLLSITAMREKGASTVEEVDAFFDRPVQIKELVISSADGKKIEGDIYQSVFDMAGVLKPKDTKQFKAGMPVKVRWSVTDKLGRSASAESDMVLEVKDH